MAQVWREAWNPVGPILFCGRFSMCFYRFCISTMSNTPNDVSAQNATKRVLGVGALSHYTRRAKCIVGIAKDEKKHLLSAIKCALARHLSITNASSICSGVLSLHACLCSRSTPIDPNAFTKCSGVLSLHACLRSRSTPVDPFAFLMNLNAIRSNLYQLECFSA